MEEDGFIPIDGEIFYSCEKWEEGEVVNDTSLSLVAICQSDGLFSEITDWPGCRAAISCDTFPVPDFATTYLMPTQSQQVVEYEYAVYACKDGAMLEGNIYEASRPYRTPRLGLIYYG